MKKMKKNKGFVLAVMMMIILLVSLSSMALISLAREARIRTVKHVTDNAARYAADAGIERVLYQMNRDITNGAWTIDSIPSYTAELLTSSNADYSVTWQGGLTDGYQITSVGRCGLATRTVRATVELSSPFAEDFAVLTRGSLSLKNKSAVKGYNSQDPSERDVPVAIGTLSTKNGSIDIKNAAFVDGDVYIGTGGDPEEVISQSRETSISGEIFVMPTPVELPPVTVPDLVVKGTSISGKNVTLTAADSGQYTGIDISTKGTLLINGDVVLHVTGDITLNNDAEIQVPAGSSLTVYFNQNIEAKNASAINNISKSPAAIKLYGTGTDQVIDLKNSSDFYGAIYAPDGEVVVHNKVDIYGSVVVDQFEMKNSGELYYDKALKETTLNDGALYFRITRWEAL